MSAPDPPKIKKSPQNVTDQKHEQSGDFVYPPDDSRRKVTQSTCDLRGVSTPRSSIFVVPDYEPRRGSAKSPACICWSYNLRERFATKVISVEKIAEKLCFFHSMC